MWTLQETWPSLPRGNRELSDHLRPTRTGTMRATGKEMLRICGPSRKPRWKERWAPDPAAHAPKATGRGSPGGPGAETWPSQRRGRGLSPRSGTIPHAMSCGQAKVKVTGLEEGRVPREGETKGCRRSRTFREAEARGRGREVCVRRGLRSALGQWGLGGAVTCRGGSAFAPAHPSGSLGGHGW